MLLFFLIMTEQSDNSWFCKQIINVKNKHKVVNKFSITYKISNKLIKQLNKMSWNVYKNLLFWRPFSEGLCDATTSKLLIFPQYYLLVCLKLISIISCISYISFFVSQVRLDLTNFIDNMTFLIQLKFNLSYFLDIRIFTLQF